MGEPDEVVAGCEDCNPMTRADLEAYLEAEGWRRPLGPPDAEPSKIGPRTDRAKQAAGIIGQGLLEGVHAAERLGYKPAELGAALGILVVLLDRYEPNAEAMVVRDLLAPFGIEL